MARFPDNPNPAGFNRPFLVEADIARPDHQGTISNEVNSAVHGVRSGPQMPAMARRGALASMAAGLAVPAIATRPANQPEHAAIRPELEFVYEAQASLGAPIPIGETVDGTRRIIPIVAGGRVEGPLIRGELMGNAADWQLTRPDGVTVADAIYALKTDDGVIIQIRNRGLRHGPPEVMARLAAGETVDPAEYYFRTVPEFIAPRGRYDWMNRSIFVCSGARYASSIRLWVWRVA